jgi:hypothetical protein
MDPKGFVCPSVLQSLRSLTTVAKRPPLLMFSLVRPQKKEIVNG